MIVLLQPGMPNGKGAIEKMSRDIIQYSNKNKIDYKMITTSRNKKVDSVWFPKGKVVHLLLLFIGLFQLWSMLSRRKLDRLLSGINPDKIIVNSSWTYLSLNKKMHSKYNFIFVQHQGIGAYTFEDIPVMGKPFSFLSRAKRKISLFNQYSLFTRQDSNNFEREFGIKKDKIFINPNFIKIGKYTPFKNKKKDVVFFGRLVYDKNVKESIHFIDRNNMKGAFFGTGQWRFIQLVKNSKSSEYKGFTKEDPRKINSEYKFNILIANKRHEGYPLSTLEAMSVGTIPIVNKYDLLFPMHKELVDQGIAIPYDKFNNEYDFEGISQKCHEYVVKNNKVEDYCKKLLR